MFVLTEALKNSIVEYENFRAHMVRGLACGTANYQPENPWFGIMDQAIQFV